MPVVDNTISLVAYNHHRVPGSRDGLGLGPLGVARTINSFHSKEKERRTDQKITKRKQKKTEENGRKRKKTRNKSELTVVG